MKPLCGLIRSTASMRRSRKMTRTLAILLLFVVAAAGYAADHAALFASGKAAFEREEYEKAADLFRSAIEKRRGVAEYHYWLGAAYGRQAMKGNVFTQATLATRTRNEFEKAVALDPAHHAARSSLIDFYKMAPGFMGGSSAKALEQAQQIAARDPLRGRWAMAKIHIFDGKLDLARKEYAESVRENPRSGEARVAFAGFLAGRDQNYAAAIEELEASVRLVPGYMPAWYQIGRVSAMGKMNLQRGEESLKRYLTHAPGENEPSAARAHYWMGMILEQSGRKDEAKRAFSAALKMQPGFREATEALARVN
jgi:tetratricopeptide (TPR) repeat protein